MTYLEEYEKNQIINSLAEDIAEKRQEIKKLKRELRQVEAELAERKKVQS